MQAVAAQELYRREWRYHSELRLWLKARSPQEVQTNNPNVQFVYFEVNSWESRLFTSTFRGNIATGFLPEDEIKIKGNMPSISSQPTGMSNPTGTGIPSGGI